MNTNNFVTNDAVKALYAFSPSSLKAALEELGLLTPKKFSDSINVDEVAEAVEVLRGSIVDIMAIYTHLTKVVAARAVNIFDASSIIPIAAPTYTVSAENIDYEMEVNSVVKTHSIPFLG